MTKHSDHLWTSLHSKCYMRDCVNNISLTYHILQPFVNHVISKRCLPAATASGKVTSPVIPVAPNIATFLIDSDIITDCETVTGHRRTLQLLTLWIACNNVPENIHAEWTSLKHWETPLLDNQKRLTSATDSSQPHQWMENAHRHNRAVIVQDIYSFLDNFN